MNARALDPAGTGIELRPARRDEAPLVLALIRELADYERLLDDVVASEADIDSLLFGAAPRAFCEIAEWNGEVAGFALWFYNASTFRGRHGIYLEDLYVRPAFRGHGIGKALIGKLAQRCVDEGLPRLQWQVLDWNTPAIGFYESLGAHVHPAWRGCLLEDAAIDALAAGAGGGGSRRDDISERAVAPLTTTQAAEPRQDLMHAGESGRVERNTTKEFT